MRRVIAAFLRRLADRIDSPTRGRPRTMQAPPADPQLVRDLRDEAASEFGPRKDVLTEFDEEMRAAVRERDAEDVRREELMWQYERPRPTAFGRKLRGVR